MTQPRGQSLALGWQAVSGQLGLMSGNAVADQKIAALPSEADIAL
jgi:hypothetical protein